MKRVLITGENSYIGMAFEMYATEHYGNQLKISTIDMIGGEWKKADLHCVRPQDRFIKYRKKPTKVSEYSLWIEELDQEQKYVERFQPEELLSGKLTLLNESRSFDGWYYEDASHLWNFNVHYLEYLVALVGKAKITQEKKYIESVNEMFEDWHAISIFQNGIKYNLICLSA